jgi:hypothetical protein
MSAVHSLAWKATLPSLHNRRGEDVTARWREDGAAVASEPWNVFGRTNKNARRSSTRVVMSLQRFSE